MQLEKMNSETLGAGAIMDVWTGGNLDWRSRLDESDFFESADWLFALELSRAVLSATNMAES